MPRDTPTESRLRGAYADCEVAELEAIAAAALVLVIDPDIWRALAALPIAAARLDGLDRLLQVWHLAKFGVGVDGP